MRKKVKNKKEKTLLLCGAAMFGLAGLVTLCLSVIRIVNYYQNDGEVVVSVESVPEKPKPSFLKKVTWDKISAVDKDDFVGAVSAFQNSCKMLMKRSADEPLMRGSAEFGVIKDWEAACGKIADVKENSKEFKQFLIDNFEPFTVEGDGTFTGYYEASVKGSLNKTEKYKYPIFGRPDDLVEVRLDKFGITADKNKFFGRVDGGNFVPYFSRATIDKKLKNPVIAWADNPVDVFILQIQGSGRILLENGKDLKVGYAASNEKPFVAAGRVMLDKGILKSGEVTMPSIRKWLLAHPKEAKEIMNTNQRYIFFRKRAAESPVGAMGMPLTPKRSMAVDTTYIPLGVPLWLDTVDAKGKPLQRIMFAQDVGSAIKGAVRGDFFWGFGEEAFNNAGAMKSKGTYYVILPKK